MFMAAPVRQGLGVPGAIVYSPACSSSASAPSGSAREQQRVEYALLRDAAALRLRVGDLRMEHHHRIARNEAPGKVPLQRCGERLPPQELRRAHGIAHLLVILQRHGRDGIGVGAAFALELLAIAPAAGRASSGFRGRRAGGRAGGNPRSRNSGPGRGRARWRAPHRRAAAGGRPPASAGNTACRAGPAGAPQIAAARSGIARAASANWRVEEARHSRVASQPVEPGVTVARQEQRGGEAAVGIGQGDQHVAAARPDMQRLRLERVASPCAAGTMSSL